MPRPSFSTNHGQPDAKNGQAAVQEMLGAPPGWALRWGITAVLAAVVLLLMGAWLVRYPDTVTAQVVLSTAQPAIRMVAPQAGRLQQLLVEDGAQVEPGQVLAVLENPARVEDVLALRDWLQRDRLLSPPDGALQLGTLQRQMASLRRAWEDYDYYLRRSDWAQRIVSLENQQSQLSALSAAQGRKLEVLEAESALAEANFKRNETLAASGNVSQLDKERAQSAMLRLDREIREAEAQRLRNELEAERAHELLITLQQEQRNGAQVRKMAYEEARETLRALVEAWQQAYLVRSAITGNIVYPGPLSEGQYLKEGQLVMTVVPGAGAAEVLARGYLPVQNAGRVAVGMDARLFLDAYPEQQYGALPAEVRHLSLFPEQQAYYIELTLTDGMQTTYGKDLPFSQELSARANIITEDRRLLVRLFDQLRSLWDNY
jgi:HlyD family secretion protein